jgi:hypothetical protein
MTRIKLLVEGQTEEVFVRELLQPHYARMGLYMTPIIVSTRPGYKGGMSSYAKVRPQIERLCREDPRAWVTTMFDLYALPDDFPGKASSAYLAKRSGKEKVEYLEQALRSDIATSSFIPYLQQHEFEALLFSSIDKFAEWPNDPMRVIGKLSQATKKSAPEDINDSPLTAPSKRIKDAYPAYQKTFHGPLIACAIGLDVMRGACLHFDAWLKKLEQITEYS